ncbi:MAG: 5-formyltetrahydrofolate cyclo-ligase, partial [Candidatus Omnitrophota bacterium]
KILDRLKAQKEEIKVRKSKAIKEKLFKTDVFKKAKRVMFYLSFGGEVDTRDMIKAAEALGKIILLPVCRNKALKACLFDSRTGLRRGLYGISEPKLKRYVDLKKINLVVAPAVAFDKKGNRLGRGKGYYDHFLKRLSLKTTSVGLAFDFQVLPSIPVSSADVKVNKVIFA